MKTLQYAVRFLVRSRSYSLINLFGLAFSLACSIILLRYIHRELTVDTHCVDRERVVVPIRDIQVTTSLSNTSYCDSTYIPDDQIVNRTGLNFYFDAVNFNFNHSHIPLPSLFFNNCIEFAIVTLKY